MATPAEVWFITGCSSGIGISLASQAFAHGHAVVATARNPDLLSYLPDHPRVLKLRLDVTSPNSIKSAFQETLAKFGRVDVVVNNAGLSLIGDTEAITEVEARQRFETNFWGAAHVTEAALPIFREINPKGEGGFVIQISAMAGRTSLAGLAYYSASKFALEGYTEGLSKEMHPDWNIKFLSVLPGGVQTPFAQSSGTRPRHPAYDIPGAPHNSLAALMADPSFRESWMTADKLAQVVLETAAVRKSRELPLRLLLGASTVAVIEDETKTFLKDLEEWRSVSESVTPMKYRN